ncbi:hypothetical protein [Candidatus Clostridium radicumherbarum]|uniref:Thioredoxin domain-containing protein n=1 Tax=Candidatus Clostridium radicumherbarum TaxID=3381662 RepID=A0ABW8TSD1_9CLOT
MNRWRKGVFLLASIIFFIGVRVNVFAEDSGLLTNLKNVPIYTNEEFNKAPIRLEIFTASWCSRCARLKPELPEIIYKKYHKEQVAMRIYQIDDGTAAPHLMDLENKVNIPAAAKGSVPSIFINETYYYAGYDSDISKKLLEDIDAIINGRKVPNGGNITVNTGDKTEKNGVSDNGSGTIEKRLTKAFNIFMSGLGDSINFYLILLCYLSYIYFIDSKKKKKLLITLTYFIGMFMTNIIILQGQLPLICNKSYISIFKITFTLFSIYLLYNILEAAMNKLFYGKVKFSRISRSFLKSLANVLNSSYGYLISAVIGLLIMYSQVSNIDSHYIDMFAEINVSILTWNKLAKVFSYTLGVAFPIILLGIVMHTWSRLRKFAKADIPIMQYSKKSLNHNSKRWN